MRKVLIVFGILTSVTIAASVARAQCAFDDSRVAPFFRGFMVRYYEPCTGAPNSTTQAGIPSCAPPVPQSLYEFDSQNSARCLLRLVHYYEALCTDGSGIACSNVLIRSRCNHLLLPDGVTPSNGESGWALVLGVQFTLDDNSNSDMTVTNFAFQINFPVSSQGDISLWVPGVFTNDLLAALFGAGNALPGCTSIGVRIAEVHDPDGNIFAALGTSRRL